VASIIEFRLPIEQFALAHTFEEVANLHVEIERFAAQDPDSVMPFVWVTTDDFEAFETAVDDDPSVESYSRLAECNGEQFYRMDWIADAELAIHLLIEKDAAITTAQTTGESWEFQVMCPEHDSLSVVYDFCAENGLSLTVDSIYELDGKDGSAHGLSESQHSSLMKAREMGYYDVPREVSLTELADELDVSHQALSERLRRGHANLIDRALSSEDHTQDEAPPAADHE
jgi:predicted DNA binding protein